MTRVREPEPIGGDRCLRCWKRDPSVGSVVWYRTRDRESLAALDNARLCASCENELKILGLFYKRYS